MEIIGVLLAAIALVVSILFYYQPSWIRPKKLQPRLELELVCKGMHSAPHGYVLNALEKERVVIDGVEMVVIDGDSAPQIFSMDWKLELIIRNNSDVAAYKTKVMLIKHSAPIKVHDVPGRAILNHNELTVKGEYERYIECPPGERVKYEDYKTTFQSLRILIEYQNNDGDKFYTLYAFKDENKNQLFSKLPKGIETI